MLFDDFTKFMKFVRETAKRIKVVWWFIACVIVMAVIKEASKWEIPVAALVLGSFGLFACVIVLMIMTALDRYLKTNQGSKVFSRPALLLLWVFLLIVAFSSVMTCSSFFWDTPLPLKSKLFPAPAMADMSAAVTVRIVKPARGAKARFITAAGQGGRVEVSGESPPLANNLVILLTVTPPIGAGEIPQTPSREPVRPSADGTWTTNVQVGNTEYPPRVGERFTIKVYVVPEVDYVRLRYEAENGRYSWPLPDRPKAVDICVIELAD
jgi:hypothetical protein